MTQAPRNDQVPSPCIRLCTLDEQEVCVGCYRSLNDIMNWRDLDPAGRLAVLDAADRRRAAAAGTGIGGQAPGRVTPRG
ncbi:DUF1289 domain-containing protein [Azospirillum humicireducens]|uniref:DUF1289 domain-containing protein n=1 Tax=Azospirillum humicireducens TaxID=1226968 RepID=A0A160JJ63_9PROT|nr:DUF1289 domain-containing protein [Azospirillum humicireducens]ANC93200.1 DUF1289 domain-containing protein [Azospirillum humicireducens]